MNSDENGDPDNGNEFCLTGEPEKKKRKKQPPRGPRNRDGTPKLELISASKIHNFLFCPRQYYLNTIMKENGIPMSYFLALYRKLTDAYDSLIPDKEIIRGTRKRRPDLRRVGPDLVHLNDLLPEELPKYLTFHSAEAFAARIHSSWKNIMWRQQRVEGRHVAWHGISGAMKKRASAQWVLDACTNYYKDITTNGLPILGYRDHDLSFDFDGRRYTVRYHEFRPNLSIGASKTRGVTNKELNSNWLITLQLLGFCQMAHDHHGLRWAWRVPDELAESWGGNESYIDDQVSYRYHNTREGTVRLTTRSDEDLEDMINTIDGALEHIAYCYSNNEFPPNHKSCFSCKYNIEMPGTKDTYCGQQNPKTMRMKVV